MENLKDYKISEKTVISKSNGEPLYDMYTVTLIFEDNTRKKIKVFAAIDSINEENKELAKGFMVDRLLGENGLLKREGREDYIFLGKLLSTGKDHYKPHRFYSIEGTEKNAQRYFDEDIYPLLQKLFADKKEEEKVSHNKQSEVNKKKKVANSKQEQASSSKKTSVGSNHSSKQATNDKQVASNNTQSRIYNELKSPFDNESTLMQLIKLYAQKKVYFSENLYYEIAKMDSENENEREKHVTEFIQEIMAPSYQELYDNLKSEKGKFLKVSPRFKEIFSRLKTYEEFLTFKSENNVAEIYQLYQKINLCKDDEKKKDKYMEKVLAFGLPEEEINFRINVGGISELMQELFDGGPDIMGFHVNPQVLQSIDADKHIEKPEMKFYINAGYDTYRFARYFKEKCNQRKANYYFKVVNPFRNEHDRTDKLCIYTEIKDADMFLDIIEEVSAEHTDIKYRKPPILTGTIDGFIGVGTDKLSNMVSSYNYEMSEICFSVLQEVFEGVPKEEILDRVKRNPEILQKIKSMISAQATTLGLSREKICIKEDAVPKLRNAELQRKIKEAQREGRNLDEQMKSTDAQDVGE